MRNFIKLFITTILFATAMQAAAFTQRITSQGVSVTISSRQPLSVGTNTIFVEFNGTKYKGAKVRLRAFMPAMPGMPAMKSTADATSLGGKKYKANLNLAMAGTWQLFIYIATSSGEHKRIKTFLNF